MGMRAWGMVALLGCSGSGSGPTDTGAPPAPACADAALRDGSCLTAFFACFDAAGSCSVADAPAEGVFEVVALTWSNGASYAVGRDPVSGDVFARATDSGGATCAEATGTEPLSGQGRELRFTAAAGGGESTLVADATGNLLVTCPGGAEETYTASDADALLTCLGLACAGEAL